MAFTPQKGLVEKFHAAAIVPAEVTVEQLDALMNQQTETLKRAIVAQMGFLREWQRAAEQDGVDHTGLPETFSIVFGRGMKNCTPEQIRRMSGYEKAHEICKELDVKIGIGKNTDGTVHGIVVDVAEKYAATSVADTPLRTRVKVPSAAPSH